MANCRRAKDIQSLRRHVEKETQGQARVVEVDDNMKFVLLNIMPNQGLYRGANISFKVYLTDHYPTCAPEVVCLDHIYHPNIDPSEDEFNTFECTNVCVSLLDEWTVQMDLSHVVMAILFLMHHPAFDDCLSPFFDGSDAYTPMEEMEKNIRRSLRGGTVDGWVFKRVLFDDIDEEKGSPDNDKNAGLSVTENDDPSELPIDNGSDHGSCPIPADPGTNRDVADSSCTDSGAHHCNRITATAVTVFDTSGDVECANEEVDKEDAPQPVESGIHQKGLVINAAKSSLAEMPSLNVSSVCDKKNDSLSSLGVQNARNAVESSQWDDKCTVGLFREAKRNLKNVFGMFAHLWKGSSAVRCDHDENLTDFDLE